MSWLVQEDASGAAQSPIEQAMTPRRRRRGNEVGGT
jgi:hypothetical protein